MNKFLCWPMAVLSLASAHPAQAAWQKAATRHFIIYSEQKPTELRAFAERLERFDQAARNMLGMADPRIGDGNRLTIYVLDSVAAVQKLKDPNNKFLYGFYEGRYTGPGAFTPRKTDEGGRGGLKADSVLFHEYGHHLMFQNFDKPYPNWYVEGFAELLSTPVFGKDGSVMISTSPVHRAYGLFSGHGLTSRQVLESQPAKLSPAQRESIYGRGWLLVHYLTFEPSRSGQLSTYIANLSKGQPAAAAAVDAFGDLKQLDRELNKYVLRRRLAAMSIASGAINTGPIEVAPVSAGGSEAMPWRIMSKRGVNPTTAATVVGKLRPIGARYPDDPLVQVALAEAEFDAGAPKAALAAANAVLRAEPRNVEGLIYKGRALIEMARKDKGTGSFAEGRETYLAANKIDTEDPEPLYLYFQSYLHEGKRPSANAIAALHYASVLSPQDQGLRMSSALAWLNEAKLDEARADLLPIAYDPHDGDLGASARSAIEKIDAKDGKAGISALLKR